MLRRCTVFDSYKNYEQKLAVYTALRLPPGHTLLIAQPTGGGKSLVTQLLAAQGGSLTVVIVPTVALALDQEGAARRNLTGNTQIFSYQSSQSNEERSALYRAIREKTANLLFTSPEAILKNQQLYELLEEAVREGYLSNVVIDEAHVVPDWGVFFRPDFQIFSVILKKWRRLSQARLRTFLLSATLSDDVVETLLFLFGEKDRNVQFRCDTLRREPRFCFHAVKQREKQTEKALEAIRLLPKPMVVYVLEPVDAVNLQKELKNLGFKNIPIFTGDTPDRERDQILQGWKDQRYDVVIGTSAFGIGVDKPDVRTILHVCVPENLSRFYQEVGRGGRDGFPSLSVMIPFQSQTDGREDLRRANSLTGKVLREETTVNRWFGMLHSPSAVVTADTCILDTSSTPPTMSVEEADYAGSYNQTWNLNLLLFLHRTGFVDLQDAVYCAETDSYRVTARLLQPEILSDELRMEAALAEPRARERNRQTEGYVAIRNLVQHPERTCWGRTFKRLFPLSREVCQGCPATPEGRFTLDELYKLRQKPELTVPQAVPSRALKRKMGNYRFLVIPRSGQAEEFQALCDRAVQYGIQAVAAPRNMMPSFPGLTLDYEEFFFAAERTPYLFAGGILCCLSDDAATASALFRSCENLPGYRCLLYVRENTVLLSTGKSVRDSVDGYRVEPDRF